MKGYWSDITIGMQVPLKIHTRELHVVIVVIVAMGTEAVTETATN